MIFNLIKISLLEKVNDFVERVYSCYVNLNYKWYNDEVPTKNQIRQMCHHLIDLLEDQQENNQGFAKSGGILITYNYEILQDKSIELETNIYFTPVTETNHKNKYKDELDEV